MHFRLFLKRTKFLPLRPSPYWFRGMASFTEVHDAAVANFESSYIDPETGYSVFTELAHKKRGKCCGSGCRHCPFDFEKVKESHFSVQPHWLHRCSSRKCDLGKVGPIVLFWSGDKESLLALRALVRQTKEDARSANSSSSDSLNITLLCTYDPRLKIVTPQNFNLDNITKQAAWLNLDCLGIPLLARNSRCGKSPEGHARSIQRALALLQSGGKEVRALAFGDSHVEEVRDWRIRALSPLGIPLVFPLWDDDRPDRLSDQIFADLERSSIEWRGGGGEAPSTSELINCEAPQALTERSSSDSERGGELFTFAEVWKGKSVEEVLGL